MINDAYSIWRLVALLNRSRTLVDLCKNNTCESYQKLSREIHRLLRDEVISKHFLVPLEVVPRPVTFVLVSKNQKVALSCFSRTPHIIIKYYTYAGHPFEIYYTLEDCSSIEESINSTTCRLEICEQINETLIPLEEPNKRLVKLKSYEQKTSLTQPFDEIDINVLVELFRFSNPPVEKFPTKKAIIELIKDRLGISSASYHYYSHIHDIVRVHYATRNKGDFLALIVQSSSIHTLENCLNTILSTDMVFGLWQVLIARKIPVLAVIHAWGDINKLMDPTFTHDHVKNTSYVIYPVLGVSYKYR